MTQLPEFTGPAGAAFLLSEPAPFSSEFDHPEGRVLVRKGAANVTVNLLKPRGPGSVNALAWRVIQETFDVVAARSWASVTFEINAANRNLYAPRTLHPA